MEYWKPTDNAFKWTSRALCRVWIFPRRLHQSCWRVGMAMDQFISGMSERVTNSHLPPPSLSKSEKPPKVTNPRKRSRPPSLSKPPMANSLVDYLGAIIVLIMILISLVVVGIIPSNFGTWKSNTASLPLMALEWFLLWIHPTILKVLWRRDTPTVRFICGMFEPTRQPNRR
jgi:hypothetical protein